MRAFCPGIGANCGFSRIFATIRGLISHPGPLNREDNVQPESSRKQVTQRHKFQQGTDAKMLCDRRQGQENGIGNGPRPPDHKAHPQSKRRSGGVAGESDHQYVSRDCTSAGAKEHPDGGSVVYQCQIRQQANIENDILTPRQGQIKTIRLAFSFPIG